MAYSFYTKQDLGSKVKNKFYNAYDDDPHFAESQRFLMKAADEMKKVIDFLNQSYDLSVGVNKDYTEGLGNFIKTAVELKHDMEGFE